MYSMCISDTCAQADQLSWFHLLLLVLLAIARLMVHWLRRRKKLPLPHPAPS